MRSAKLKRSLVRRTVGWLGLIVLLTGCSKQTPVVQPETANFMPDDFKGVYLGMEKVEVDQRFDIQATHLTDRGLETETRFTRDSVQIGLAFAYRDGRIATATIWYNYALVPNRIEPDRQQFLKQIIERNGGEYDRCSFNMPGEDFVPDVGLHWDHSGSRVVVTYTKPHACRPDTVFPLPYYQFSIFDSLITPTDLWPNILIPAGEADRPCFEEADSLSSSGAEQQEPPN